MQQTKYVNEKQGVEVTVTRTDYFGLQVRIEKNGILGYEGQVSADLVDKMIEKLELTKTQ